MVVIEFQVGFLHGSHFYGPSDESAADFPRDGLPDRSDHTILPLGHLAFLQERLFAKQHGEIHWVVFQTVCLG